MNVRGSTLGWTVVASILVIPAALLPLSNPAWGDALVWLATLALVGATFAGLISFRDRDAWAWERRLWSVATWALVTALTALVLHFLLGDLDLKYVWSHTRVDYPWYYRLAGTWGGQEGTVLLWATALAVFGFASAPHRDADADKRRLHHGARIFLALATGSLAALALYQPVFAVTAAEFLKSAPSGTGLQEVLVTPLMVIHPPLQFVAYALAALPAAFALSGLATRTPWAARALAWARPAWAVSTIGLGLGGLWAYYVLSFGGFWAWDPVETANLLPWLTLTAFMHAVKDNEKRGAFALAAPALAALTYILSVFATFATRSGLWVSVHAFTDPTNRFDPDAAARLVSILRVAPAAEFFLGMLGVMVAITGAVLLASAHASSVKRAPRAALRIASVLLIVYGALAAAAPRPWISAQFEFASQLGVDAGWGPVIFLGALTGVPLAWAYVDAPEPDEPRKTRQPRRLLARIIEPQILMATAVALFFVSFVVAFILDFSVINGMNRIVFDVRAPFLATPILLVLTLMLAHPHIGRGGALALVSGALALGIGGAFAFPEHWVLALGSPVLAGGFFAAVMKTVAVNRGAKGLLRVGGVLILLAGIAGAVMWANPPNHLELGALGTLKGGLLHAFLLVPLSLVGIIGGVAALRATGFRVALTGGVAATLVAGFGFGAVLGLLGLVLVVMNRRAFKATKPREFIVRTLPSFKQTGIYLIHVAVIIGIFGFAFGTYESTHTGWNLANPVRVGETVEAGDTSITFVGMQEGALPGDMEGALALTGPDGASRGTAQLHYWYRLSDLPRYLGEVDVHRGLIGDRYFVPAAFATERADGVLEWTELGKRVEPRTALFMDRGDVVAVAFDVAILPFIGFVWAGLYLMTAGMIMVIVANAGERALLPRGNRSGAVHAHKASRSKARG